MRAKKSFKSRYFSSIQLQKEYVLILVIFLILNIASPKIVSWDGYLYIASGKALFTNDIESWYHWAREPGYPFIIWFCLKLGSLQYLFVLQNIVLALAITLFINSWNAFPKLQMSKRKSQLAFILMFLGMHGYANTVLQTTWYILICSILTYTVTQIQDNKKTIYWLIPISAFFSALLAIGMAFSFICVMVILLTHRKLMTQATSIMVIASILGCLITSISWIQIKNSFDLTESNFQGVTSAFDSFKSYTGEQSFFSSLDQITQTPFSLIGLAPERYTGIQTQTLSGEAKIFGTTKFSDEHICGMLYSGPGDYPNYVSEHTNFPCSSESFVSLLSIIGGIAGAALLPLAGVGSLLIFLYAIFQSRQFRLLLVPTFFILLPYVVIGAAISRYGAPTFAFGVLGLLNANLFFKRN